MDSVQNDHCFRSALFKAIREYDHFTDDNDPYGEHDMAFFECSGMRLLWKINYYNQTLDGHSPDETDPAVTVRILTVSMADEY